MKQTRPKDLCMCVQKHTEPEPPVMEGKSHGLPKLQKAQLKARSWTHAWISTTRNWGKMLEPKKSLDWKQLRCTNQSPHWFCNYDVFFGTAQYHAMSLFTLRFPAVSHTVSQRGMRSNLGDFSHEFQEGYEEQKVAWEARVWWPSTSFGRRTWPEAQVEKLVKHEDAQTNSAKCLGDNMAKWKIEKQQQQHDNVTPCVVPRTKYTCVTLSGMGKHVAQRCTSPPGKCGKLLLAFFRKTHLAKT